MCVCVREDELVCDNSRLQLLCLDIALHCLSSRIGQKDVTLRSSPSPIISFTRAAGRGGTTRNAYEHC